MKDKFDIFGGLPDTIEDDWIESVEKLEQMMDQYVHLRQRARDMFELPDRKRDITICETRRRAEV